MTTPAPRDADFIFCDIVVDEAVEGEAKLVVIEFETRDGPIVLRLPAAGALELATNLLQLPLEHHSHSRSGRPL